VPLTEASSGAACPLTQQQGTQYVVHCLGPNMNPRRPDCLDGDYAAGAKVLAQAYDAALAFFAKETGLRTADDSAQGDGGNGKRARGDATAAGDSAGDDKRAKPGGTIASFFKPGSSSSSSAAPSAAPSAPTGRAGGGWANGLRRYLTNPEEFGDAVVTAGPRAVVIRDKFPKARHHYLVVARDAALNSITDLRGDAGADLVCEMLAMGHSVARGAARRDPAIAPFRLGFHAFPSMQQLHMHVISQDFLSDRLKTSTHWNSFATGFFVDARVVVLALRAQGSITLDRPAYENFLKGDLRCNRCNVGFSRISALKKHLENCTLPPML
jgi:aprataxin